MPFRDRSDAGERLARALRGADLHSPVVLALPRGGVPVGFEVAQAFDAPLDVFLVRKIGAPGRPELGLGAIAEGSEPLFDRRILDAMGLRPGDVQDVVEAEQGELARRERRYRGDRPLTDVTGCDVVVVDDGLATGVTARAALRALRPLGPRRLLLAVPVGAAQTVRRLQREADEIVCLHVSDHFGSVGQWYDEFAQVPDAVVIELLARAGAGSEHGTARERPR